MPLNRAIYQKLAILVVMWSLGLHRILILRNILITDGIKEVAEKEECFWFLEIIASYQMYKEFKNAEH